MTVYIIVPSWWCSFYGFRQRCNDMYPSLWYHTEYFHCPKNPLCYAYSSWPHPTNHLSFTFSIILPFPECHITKSYWLHSDWHLRFLHVFLWLDSSFRFSAALYSTVWMYHSLFIHSPTEGHIRCFWRLWIKLL